MSTWFLNVHPKTFPDPWKYKPERWVEAAQEGYPLTSYLGSFSRGTRGCIGQKLVQLHSSVTCTSLAVQGLTKANRLLNYSLAYAELSMTFARVFRKFDMELDNTTTKDISVEKIYMTGYPRFPNGTMNGEAEVKVKIKHKLET